MTSNPQYMGSAWSFLILTLGTFIRFCEEIGVADGSRPGCWDWLHDPTRSSLGITTTRRRGRKEDYFVYLSGQSTRKTLSLSSGLAMFLKGTKLTFLTPRCDDSGHRLWLEEQVIHAPGGRMRCSGASSARPDHLDSSPRVPLKVLVGVQF